MANFHPSHYADDSSYYDDYYGYDDDQYDYYGDGSYDDSYDHDGFFDELGNYYQHDGYGNYYNEEDGSYYDDSYDHDYDQSYDDGYDHHDYNVNNYYDSHNYNSSYTNAPHHNRSLNHHYYGGGGRGLQHYPQSGYGSGGYGRGYGSNYQPPVENQWKNEDPEQFEYHEAPEWHHEEQEEQAEEQQVHFQPSEEHSQEQWEPNKYRETEQEPEFTPQLTRSASVAVSCQAESSPETEVLRRAHSVMWRPLPLWAEATQERRLPRLKMPVVPETGSLQGRSPLAIFHNHFWRNSNSPSTGRSGTPVSASVYYTPTASLPQ